jgi:riboflavin kinase/FMN adenylyltransferase
MTRRDIGIMEVTSDISKVKKDCVLTIGNFDGVHIGHQAILAAAKRTAVDRAAKLIVMTFEPHPLAILRPQSPPGILTPLILKKHLLAESGVDYLFVVESSPGLLRLSPADFIDKFLVENIQPAIAVEGEDFNFGAERIGGVDTLRQLGIEKGFEVSVVDSKEVKFLSGRTAKISSTMIRDMLKAGRVADAAVALGRPYRLVERIVPGRGKGKQLGFPTANMKKKAPADCPCRRRICRLHRNRRHFRAAFVG